MTSPKPQQFPEDKGDLNSLSEISKIAGGAPPLLPGESEEGYLFGRQGAIEELGAKTPLQVFLAEKIFDCLWWMRIYETQKRTTLIRVMVDHLIGLTNGNKRLDITKAITEGNWAHDELAHHLQIKGLTPEALMQYAMSQKPSYLYQLDDQMALRAKTLMSLQTSYEALVNRSVLQERLRLQNELLRRDLTAIPIEEVIPRSQTSQASQTKADGRVRAQEAIEAQDDQPSKARRQ